MEPKLKVNIAGVEWKNPITTASGTFGSGREFADFFDLSTLGAVTTKGVSLVPWRGNPPPRIAETKGGMLNSIGLQNPGAERFIADDIPFLRRFDTKIIVNICGHTEEEYAAVAERFYDEDVDMLELNISCPNVACGGLTFGSDAKITHKTVAAVKKVCRQPLIVKLSPNVTDITEIAKAAEAAGASALSLINTLVGMKIDINTKKPVLQNKTGGLSGPAVHPVAVRMVWQVYEAVKLPIIGMGGVTDAEDAIELILAGASAVAVGGANFVNPLVTQEIIRGLTEYLKKNNIKSAGDIVGAAHEN